MAYEIIPIQLGSIILYIKQPTGVLNTAHLFHRKGIPGEGRKRRQVRAYTKLQSLEKENMEGPKKLMGIDGNGIFTYT